MKEQIKIGDVVLLYQNNFPQAFLHIHDIKPDIKPGWHKVTLLKLEFPVIGFTWLLDEDHLVQEEFTMNGVPVKLQIFSRPNDFNQLKEEIDKQKSVKEPVTEIVSKKANVVYAEFGKKKANPIDDDPEAA